MSVRLEDYDVYPDCGFLPNKFPLERLPQEYYKPWEELVNNLPSLILVGRIRQLVDDLEVLSINLLSGDEQYRRAYQVLGFLAHAYIWSSGEPVGELPDQISKPLLEVAEYLRLPPLATYAGLCLWNFKKIFPSKEGEDEFDLSNITTINTFTGSIDESWFYLISVYFEKRAGQTIKNGVDAISLVSKGDVQGVTAKLQAVAEDIDFLGSLLLKMEEMCDPYVFFFRIRPYLAGWKNMVDAGLPKDGIIYGSEDRRRAYAGGSNAQSSVIQFLDLLLKVDHYPTGERPALTGQPSQPILGEKDKSFINEMREYMPGKHADFLRKIEEVANIREFVFRNGDANPELTLSYDACLAMLKSFRDKHIQIVTRYIVLQAKKAPKLGSSTTKRSGLAKVNKTSALTGTGGTALLPFLKQCRDETGDPAAGTWGKRILTDGAMRLKYSKANGVNED